MHFRRTLLILPLLAACGLPSPDQARRNLAPKDPLTPEYRDIPLLRLEVKATELYDLLFGGAQANPNAQLLVLSQAQGQMQPGDLVLKIGVPDIPNASFFVGIGDLGQTIERNLPPLAQIPGVGPQLQNLLAQIQLPEAYLSQEVVLTSPQKVKVGNLAACAGNTCTQAFQDTQGRGSTANPLEFFNGQPLRITAEASALFNALGPAPFQGPTALRLSFVPLPTLQQDPGYYLGQLGSGCNLLPPGCNVAMNIQSGEVLAPFGGQAPNPFTVTSKALTSPVSSLPPEVLADLKEHTLSTTLTLEISTSLPTEVEALTLWLGSGTTPRFTNPDPKDFVYTYNQAPIPAAPVDGQGRSTGTQSATVQVNLSQAEIGKFLEALTQPDLHAAAQLRLRGPADSGSVFRFKVTDSLKIFAKGTARLKIGGQ